MQGGSDVAPALFAHVAESPHMLLSGTWQLVGFKMALQVPWRYGGAGTEAGGGLTVRTIAGDR